ncbi:hypothetical protein P3T76_005445 [Phytophthora citrophthora]|uniref:Uncharacterized protein n=1 Tax=Phytophthora citrophthora TaxID=4793 RepID=A0AAD9GRA1_9STRA|nr:hypothetical protein P3T76_005445 [Phytophthora citrophthora]
MFIARLVADRLPMGYVIVVDTKKGLDCLKNVALGVDTPANLALRSHSIHDQHDIQEVLELGLSFHCCPDILTARQDIPKSPSWKIEFAKVVRQLPTSTSLALAAGLISGRLA